MPTRSREAIRGALRVGAIHGARQAVWRVVGDAHRIIVTVVGNHREHRSEDLLSGDSGVIGQPCDDRGLDVETDLSIRRPRATACEPSAFGDRQVEVALHTIPLSGRNQRPANGSGSLGSPGLIDDMVAAAMATASS